MTLMLVPKNLRKSHASVDSNPTQRDGHFWMFRAMSAKPGSSSLGLIELMDDSSDVLLGVEIIVDMSGGGEWEGGGGNLGCVLC